MEVLITKLNPSGFLRNNLPKSRTSNEPKRVEPIRHTDTATDKVIQKFVDFPLISDLKPRIVAS